MTGKDRIFVGFLAENDLIDRGKIERLIDKVPVSEEKKEALRKRLDLAFTKKKKHFHRDVLDAI